MTTHDLDAVLAALNHHRQRATYGAVAALLDKTPRMLMRGRQRGPNSCWIVASNSGKPTGYAETELHPDLTASSHVLTTREELAAWLEEHGATAAV